MLLGLPALCRAPLSHGRLILLKLPSTSPTSPLPRLSRSPPQLVRHLQSQQFSPFTPPNPADLPKPRIRKVKPPLWRRKWVRRFFIVSAIVGTGYVTDVQFNASSLTRSFRTFKTGLLVGVDYKINFRAHPPLAPSIEALHVRNAERVF